MARRPIEDKQRRRVAKKLRRTSLPAFFDLVQWLVDHGHAATKPEAKRLILAKRVKSDSHTLGIRQEAVIEDRKLKFVSVVARHVPTSLRDSVTVLATAPDPEPA